MSGVTLQLLLLALMQSVEFLDSILHCFEPCIHQQSDDLPGLTMSCFYFRGRQSSLQWRQRTLLQTHAPGSTGLCWKGGETTMDLPGGESIYHEQLPPTLTPPITATSALPLQPSLYSRALQSKTVGSTRVRRLRSSQPTLTLPQVPCTHSPACIAEPCKAIQLD